MSFSFEPPVTACGFGQGSAEWEELDKHLSDIFQKPAIAIPSVRVGLLWTLQHLGANRHEHEVLMPRYIGRCILDALHHAARPAHTLSNRTRLAVMVHTFGLKQDIETIRSRLQTEGVPFVEDASDSMRIGDSPVSGSLGKFIALSKLLPLLKGGCFLPGDPDIADMLRRKRSESTSRWVALWIQWVIGSHRRGRDVPGSAWVESAYALYPCSPSDSPSLRGSFYAALSHVKEYAAIEAERLKLLKDAVPGALIETEPSTLLRCALLRPDPAIAAALAHQGFSSTPLHYDHAGNMLAPYFKKALAVALHPGISQEAFTGLIQSIQEKPLGNAVH